ncbi:hypothetical protein ACVU7I_00020 [Patulibacter sp. S7RM1-6]
MTDQPTATVTIVDHRGALEAGEAPATRTVQVAGLAPNVAGKLAAAVLGLPPSRPVPGPGTHRTAKAGGYVAVTIDAAK